MRYLMQFEEVFFINKIKKNKIDKKINDICKEYGIRDYTINKDGSIDVYSSVYLIQCNLTKLPLKFNQINGDFYCHNNNLTSLKGSPYKINNVFSCSSNRLKTLEYSPNCSKDDFFICYNNELTSLDYAPREVHSFYCNDNKLRSLKGSLKYIDNELNCSNNMIATFYEFPRIISNLICIGNPIFELWKLFEDLSKIELFNDYDMIREEYTDKPVIIMDMLNDFLLTIGRPTVEYVYGYKNI